VVINTGWATVKDVRTLFESGDPAFRKMLLQIEGVIQLVDEKSDSRAA
jgi:hypothetical protein